MATYRQIHTHIWDDPKFEELSPHAKLLFIYGFSNKHRNEAGLYTITVRKIAFETSLTTEQAEDAINEIEKIGMWRYDWDNHVLWIKNALKYQSVSEKCLVAIRRDIDAITSPLVEEFKEYYKDILYPIDTLSKPYPNPTVTLAGNGKGKGNSKGKDSATKKTLVNTDTDTDTPTQKINNMPASGDAGESEPLGSNGLTSHEDGKRVQNEHCSGAVSKKKGTHDYTPEFEEFWSVYPKKVEKLAAFQQWKARIRQGYEPEDLITAAKNYAIAVQGKEPDFIKYPKTFLGKTLPFKEFMPGAGPPEQRTPTAPTRQLTDTEEYMRQLEIEVFGHELPG